MTMTVHFFTIPALASQPAQDEFNHFCSMRRVVAVDRQFVADGRDSYWALCATVAPGSGLLPDALKAPERRSGVGKEGVASSSVRIDYKEVLSEGDFAQYAELRLWRKSAAEREGVPVYAVFTNEQLAEIVRRRVGTLAALGEIDGIGPSRLERYGEAVLAWLQAGPPAHATGQPA